MGNHHLRKCALRPLPFADTALYFQAQRAVVEHAEIDIEQRLLFFRELVLQPVLDGGDVFAHRLQALKKEGNFGVDILAGAARHRVQIRLRNNQHCGAHGNAGRAGNTGKFRAARGIALAILAANGPGRLGVGDDPGKLGGHGDQKGLLVLVEAPTVLLLYNQHTLQAPLVNYRHPQKGVVQLFANAFQIEIAGVFFRVVQIQRLFTPRHNAYQTLILGKADNAHELGVKALVCHHHQTAGFKILEVDRAHLNTHHLGDALHHDIQRGLQVVGGIDRLHNPAQGVEHHPPALRLSSLTRRLWRAQSSFIARR